ncbi:MAG: hypothetical protein WBA66_00370 [Xanthobacteraceae bacterium]
MNATENDRAAIIDWLHLVKTGALRAGADRIRFAQRLINALVALDEGRVDPLLKSAKKANSAKTKREVEEDALIVASVDALIKIGISRNDAARKVGDIAGMKPGAVIDLRKKVSGKGAKYKAHRPRHVANRKRVTLGLVDRGLPSVTEETIINNLAMSLILSRGA